MDRIKYLTGDASQPTIPGPKIIAHVVNDQGAWGAGFTKSLTHNWPLAGADYRDWYQFRHTYIADEKFSIGKTRNTLVRGSSREGILDETLWVCHMVAQEGLIARRNPRPLRYDALGACLLRLRNTARNAGATVHMPRIGCGLAGGEWAIVQHVINDALTRGGIDTYVYDLEI